MPTSSRWVPGWCATELALDIVDVFMTTDFEGGRHVPRLEEITAIEDQEADGSDGASTAR